MAVVLPNSIIIDKEKRICIEMPPVEETEIGYKKIGNKTYAFMKSKPRLWIIYPTLRSYFQEDAFNKLMKQTYKDMFEEALNDGSSII